MVDDLLLDFGDKKPTEKDSEQTEQLRLIREQIDRCKDALSVISASAGKQRADEGQSLPVDRYLRQLAEQWQVERPGVSFTQQLKGPQPAPSMLADRALNQALTNIFNNAADVSPDSVELQASWDAQSLDIHILDRGPGISEAAVSAAGKTPFSSKKQGLGVGLFLAHAVVERLGGHVSHRRRETGGTCTCINLPLIGVRP
ncbi:Sensor histidine kinase PrrB (RegB) [hydrothermal vent metagenome]|uniref:histidine kinase n=1 Tax=hydrothermal vent metagenome TaxID=652676 RepID=A0A3B1AQ42_9ZZZZ